MDGIDLIREHDRILDLFGMRIDEAREGFARVSAVVPEEGLNAHGVAHGSFLTAVFDVAFAVCVNSVTDAVGVQWNVNLFRPAQLGERVTAECRLVHRGRRMMVVEFDVRGPEERLLAKGQATAMPVPRDALRESKE